MVVKYCGGCNCQIDRAAVVREIEQALPSGFRLMSGPQDAAADAGILVCGCASACAWKPELQAQAKRWITIGGKTVDSREMPENAIARAVVAKLTQGK